ncbi:hypothetical protein B0H19DRAFT_1275528 [Mycena capillaripes]|nr:hypothetical protein B0H19DRAFT_1275528 [Mycena capillaripes]
MAILDLRVKIATHPRHTSLVQWFRRRVLPYFWVHIDFLKAQAYNAVLRRRARSCILSCGICPVLESCVIAHAPPNHPNLRSYLSDSIGIQTSTVASTQLPPPSLSLTSHGRHPAAPRPPPPPHGRTALPRHLSHDSWPLSAAGLRRHRLPTPSLPLSAPWPAAGHILPRVPVIAHLRVKSPIIKVDDAL